MDWSCPTTSPRLAFASPADTPGSARQASNPQTHLPWRVTRNLSATAHSKNERRNRFYETIEADG